MLLVIWVASSLIFFMPRLIHQNAIEQRFRDLDSIGAQSGQMSEARREIARQYQERFGFGRPLWSQYLRHLGKLARFDLGYSMSYYPVTVKEVLRDSVFWTLGLLSVTTSVAFVLGTAMGGLLGWPALHGWARASFIPLVTLSALPYYLLALALVFVFAFRLEWFPLSGAYRPGTLPEFSFKFVGDLFSHALLPAISIILASAGVWALQMRGMIVTVLAEDYVVMAQAKGLRRARVFLRYALRNAMLPQVTGLAISLGTVLSGVVLVEVIFRYPGIGDALHRAIRRGDYFVISGLVYVVIISLALATFLLDVSYPRLDPRIRRRV